MVTTALPLGAAADHSFIDFGEKCARLSAVLTLRRMPGFQPPPLCSPTNCAECVGSGMNCRVVKSPGRTRTCGDCFRYGNWTSQAEKLPGTSSLSTIIDVGRDPLSTNQLTSQKHLLCAKEMPSSTGANHGGRREDPRPQQPPDPRQSARAVTFVVGGSLQGTGWNRMTSNGGPCRSDVRIVRRTMSAATWSLSNRTSIEPSARDPNTPSPSPSNLPTDGLSITILHSQRSQFSVDVPRDPQQNPAVCRQCP